MFATDGCPLHSSSPFVYTRHLLHPRVCFDFYAHWTYHQAGHQTPLSLILANSKCAWLSAYKLLSALYGFLLLFPFLLLYADLLSSSSSFVSALSPLQRIALICCDWWIIDCWQFYMTSLLEISTVIFRNTWLEFCSVTVS